MNKCIFNIVLLLILLFLTGCSVNEIEDYYIVAGMGIDYKDDLYEVTFEIYNENNGETTKMTSITKSGKGKIISEAVKNITITLNKQPYLNHCSMIILDNGVVQNKFSEAINYLVHDVRIRSSCYIAVSKNQTAKEIFKKSEENKTIVAYDLYKYFDLKTEILNIWTNCKFNKILNEQINKNGTVIIPTIEYDDDCVIKGVYLIKNDNSIKTLNDEVFVIQLFNNLLSEGLYKKEEISTYIKQLVSKMKYDKNKIILNISMKVLSYDNINVSEKETYINNLKKTLEQDIVNVFKKYQVLEYDPFRIYNFLNKYEPILYNDIKNDYYSFYNTLKLDINLNIDLLTLGLSEERIE